MSNLRSWLGKKSPEEIEHFLGELPRLWLEGGQLNKLSRLLSNYEFIEAKLNHPEFGIKALIEDYELIDDIDLAHPDYSEQTIKFLKLIQGALRLSTHILSQDPNQLAGQLSGRLLDFDGPDIQELLQQIPQTETTCFRSLRASLSSPTGPLLSTLSGHGDSVNAVAVTPDGTMVISGSSDNTVKVWNLNTGAEIRTLTGHTSPVNAVAITPDGTRVISGGSDNTVRVWNLATAKEILRFNGHSLPVVAVAVTPDGKKVVSASVAMINSMKVWDLETGQEELTLEGHGDLVRTVVITSDNRVISGSNDGTIKVWNLETGEMLSSLRHGSQILDHDFFIYVLMQLYVIAVTLDGKWLISGSGHQGRNMITVWNLETGEKTVPIKSHKNPISALAI
ncbi:MAG: WD40 repeat domain-containing protein, partial [Moorea sp. SIO4A3]|nr:WD40 repeat domain-containing protein [Moorena sp. SIO4A3]